MNLRQTLRQRLSLPKKRWATSRNSVLPRLRRITNSGIATRRDATRNYAMNCPTSSMLDLAPLSQLLEICQRYFPKVDDADASQRAAHVVHEIGKLQVVLQNQGEAGREFGESVNATQEKLKRVPMDSRILQQSIEGVLASNARMQARLQETDARLASSQQQIQSLQRDLHEAQRRCSRRCSHWVRQSSLIRRGHRSSFREHQADDAGR